MLRCKPVALLGAVLFVLLGLCAPASAHDYYLLDGKAKLPLLPQHGLGLDPDSVIVVPLGSKARVLVDDETGCKAFLTIVDDRQGIYSVSPDPKGATQAHTYSFTGEQLGLGIVDIQVMGEGGTCNEDSDNFFWVVVVDEKTADKEMLKFFKSSLSAQRQADKSFLKGFAEALALRVADAADGILSIDEAFDLMEDDLDLAFELTDGELDDRILDIYATAATILEAAGYETPLVGLPSIFSSNDCSPYRMTVDKMEAERSKTYLGLNKMFKKGMGKLVKLGGGSVDIAISTDPPTPIAVGPLGIGPVAKAPACPANKIRQVSCTFLAQFNTRLIKVKGKADVAQGGMVTVTIDGPKDAMGVPAYTTTVMATVGSDCKWEVQYQDNAITAGSGEVTAVHASGTATKSFSCN